MDNITQSSSIYIPIFNGKNYDLWDTIEEGFTASADISTLNATQEKELKKSKQKNSKALLVLQ